MGTTAAPDPVQLTVSGGVHGGQQAVVGAHIQLYVAGSAGNGSASSPLLTTTVTSGTDGGFSITGDYSCPSATAQVYLVATQGNPGLGSGGNNPALAMMAPLGACGNLSPTQFIWINEVTTVAAAWALAPFTQDISHIGASSTNAAGLANAFLNAQHIADTSKGTVATLPANLTTEPGKIYALADAMASCINSDGTSGCAPLFSAATPSGGSAPTNTWDAVINIVKHPGNNVAGVFSTIGPQPPFATTLTNAPNDWTLSLTVTGAGMFASATGNPPDESPESVAIDSQGNVWVSDHSGVLSAFNPQGIALSSTGFGAGNAGEAFGLAIDASDNAWLTLAEYGSHAGTKGSIGKFAGASSGAGMGISTIYTDNSLNFPYAIAADSNGNFFIANYAVTGSATNLVTFNPSANTFTPISTGTGFGFPVAIAADTAHGVWISGGAGDLSLVHVDSGGNIVFSTDCCGNTDSVALDSEGMVWVADTHNDGIEGDSSGAVTVLASDGTITHDFITNGGITVPSHIAIDAAQNVWVSNLHTTVTGATQSITELSGSTSSSPGTALSPSTGYGRDAGLKLPYALAVDPSGNVWVSNTGSASLVMFFGMAAPTKTPLMVTPQAP